MKQVNAVYHNIEAESYNARHPEIFDYQREQLGKIISLVMKKFSQSDSVICIDIGTGTGFVPETLAELVGDRRPALRWVLCDISLTMLQMARMKLENAGCVVIGCVVMDAERPAFRWLSADIITANSLLHHLPVPDEFLRRCHDLLRAGGLLILSHEPRLGYYRSVLWSAVKVVTYILLFMGRIKASVIQVKESEDHFWPKVEIALQARGITNLSRRQIQELVDIHSPTARVSPDPDRGFNPSDLLPAGCKPLHMHTYAHLGKLALKRSKGSLLRRIDGLLATAFPQKGSLFWVVACKTRE